MILLVYFVVPKHREYLQDTCVPITSFANTGSTRSCYSESLKFLGMHLTIMSIQESVSLNPLTYTHVTDCMQNFYFYSTIY